VLAWGVPLAPTKIGCLVGEALQLEPHAFRALIDFGTPPNGGGRRGIGRQGHILTWPRGQPSRPTRCSLSGCDAVSGVVAWNP